MLCGDECESVSHTLCDCSAYRSIRAQFLLKLMASLGGSYARFEAMSSLEKSSFVLRNELWEEHLEALVKAYIIDIWEERISKLYGDVECAQQPHPHSPTGDLGEIAGVNGQNSEGMCQGGKRGTGKLNTDVFMLLRQYQWVCGRWPWGYGSVLSNIIDAPNTSAIRMFHCIVVCNLATSIYIRFLESSIYIRFFQLGIFGILLGLMGRIVKRCVREVSLAQVSCILMYVYVAPLTPVDAWSMALGLRRHTEY